MICTTHTDSSIRSISIILAKCYRHGINLNDTGQLIQNYQSNYNSTSIQLGKFQYIPNAWVNQI